MAKLNELLEYIGKKHEKNERNYIIPDSLRVDTQELANRWVEQLNSKPMRGDVLHSLVSELSKFYGSNKVERIGSAGTKPVIAYKLCLRSESYDLRMKCAINEEGLRELKKAVDTFNVYNGEELIKSGAAGYFTIIDFPKTNTVPYIIELNGNSDARAEASTVSDKADIKKIFCIDKEFYLGKDGQAIKDYPGSAENHIETSVKQIIKYLPQKEGDIYEIRDILINLLSSDKAGPIRGDSQLSNAILLNGKYYYTDPGLEEKLIREVYCPNDGSDSAYLEAVKQAHIGVFPIELGYKIMSADKKLLGVQPEVARQHMQHLVTNVCDRSQWGGINFNKEDYWGPEFKKSAFSLGQLIFAVRKSLESGGGNWISIIDALIYNAKTSQATPFFGFRNRIV